MAEKKESFISSEERPVVGLHPDTPISELRVRDLQTLLQGVAYSKSPRIEFPPFKGPNGKPEKYEIKNEAADLFFPTFKPDKENETSSPGGETVSPAIDQLIQTVSGVSEQVTNLAQEVEKLKQQPNKS